MLDREASKKLRELELFKRKKMQEIEKLRSVGTLLLNLRSSGTCCILSFSLHLKHGCVRKKEPNESATFSPFAMAARVLQRLG